MIDLTSIGKFELVENGQSLVLDSDKSRVVVLELNTAEPCQLKLQTGAKELRFLANVHGRETVKFVADGPVAVWPDSEGEVWLWTSEMETSAVKVEGAKIMTRVADRARTAPSLERIVSRMMENQRRFERSMQGHVEALQRQKAAIEAENAQLREETKRDRKPKSADGAASAASGNADGAGQSAAAAPEGGAAKPGGADAKH